MILSDPPPTQADLHFRVAGFPVRVHPFFWAVGLLIGLNAFGGEPKGALLAIVVVFVSILVHELGHTFLQRKFGGRPRIVLHGFGGLAICDDCDRSPRSQILISLAGPFAGFLLALATALLVGATSGYVALSPGWSDKPWVALGQPDRVIGINLLLGSLWFNNYAAPEIEIAKSAVNNVVSMMLYVNIFWGLINLLPVYPLDGGQVARELFSLGRNPHEGIANSLRLSVGTGAAVAVLGLVALQLPFMALMFGYLAYTSYRNLQAYTGRGPSAGWR